MPVISAIAPGVRPSAYQAPPPIPFSNLYPSELLPKNKLRKMVNNFGYRHSFGKSNAQCGPNVQVARNVCKFPFRRTRDCIEVLHFPLGRKFSRWVIARVTFWRGFFVPGVEQRVPIYCEPHRIRRCSTLAGTNVNVIPVDHDDSGDDRRHRQAPNES